VQSVRRHAAICRSGKRAGGVTAQKETLHQRPRLGSGGARARKKGAPAGGRRTAAVGIVANERVVDEIEMRIVDVSFALFYDRLKYVYE